MRSHGIGNDTTVVFYGDKSNWWACYAFWIFQLFGHGRARVHGRRQPEVGAGGTPAGARPALLAAFELPGSGTRRFAHPRLPRPGPDATSPSRRAPWSMSAARRSSPASDFTCRPTRTRARCAAGISREPGACPGRERSNRRRASSAAPPSSRRIYFEEQRLPREEEIVAYCRIGERSSHTWFVLTYLLGHPQVRNYDGSWTEWGNLVGAPIER